jgi:hypothetical protein
MAAPAEITNGVRVGVGGNQIGVVVGVTVAVGLLVGSWLSGGFNGEQAGSTNPNAAPASRRQAIHEPGRFFNHRLVR